MRVGTLLSTLLAALLGVALIEGGLVAAIVSSVICSEGNGTFVLCALVVCNSAATAAIVFWLSHVDRRARLNDLKNIAPTKERKRDRS